MKWFNAIIDLFYPNLCLGCSNYIANYDHYVCSQCLLMLDYIPNSDTTNSEVKRRFYGKLKLDHAYACFYYNESGIVQSLLHHLKYHNKQGISEFLALLTINHLQNHELFKWADYIVPVPLHTKKQKIRGYNQLSKFGETLAKHYNLIYVEDFLIKTTNTQTQTKKNMIERASSNAEYYINTKYLSIENKNILIIDDVITTGSTLELIGNIILKNSSNKISILTMAYTR